MDILISLSDLISFLIVQSFANKSHPTVYLSLPQQINMTSMALWAIFAVALLFDHVSSNTINEDSELTELKNIITKLSDRLSHFEGDVSTSIQAQNENLNVSIARLSTRVSFFFLKRNLYLDITKQKIILGKSHFFSFTSKTYSRLRNHGCKIMEKNGCALGFLLGGCKPIAECLT